MNSREKLSDNAALQAAYRSAAADLGALERILGEMYCAGFPDGDYLPGVEVKKPARVIKIYNSFQKDLDEFMDHPEELLDVFMEETDRTRHGREEIYIGCGSCAAELILESHQKKAAKHMLLEGLHQGNDTPEKLAQFLNLFLSLPLERLPGLYLGSFSAGRETMPLLGPILGMASYISLKTGENTRAAPDFSFDAICVLADAAAEIMFLTAENRNTPQIVRRVTAIALLRACQWMHLEEQNVLSYCMGTVPAVENRIKQVAKNMSGTVLPELQFLRSQTIQRDNSREAVQEMIGLRKKLMCFYAERGMNTQTKQTVRSTRKEELEELTEEILLKE